MKFKANTSCLNIFPENEYEIFQLGELRRKLKIGTILIHDASEKTISHLQIRLKDLYKFISEIEVKE